jgi:hypothetical protein
MEDGDCACRPRRSAHCIDPSRDLAWAAHNAIPATCPFRRGYISEWRRRTHGTADTYDDEEFGSQGHTGGMGRRLPAVTSLFPAAVFTVKQTATGRGELP